MTGTFVPFSNGRTRSLTGNTTTAKTLRLLFGHVSPLHTCLSKSSDNGMLAWDALRMSSHSRELISNQSFLFARPLLCRAGIHGRPAQISSSRTKQRDENMKVKSLEKQGGGWYVHLFVHLLLYLSVKICRMVEKLSWFRSCGVLRWSWMASSLHTGQSFIPLLIFASIMSSLSDQ